MNKKIVIAEFNCKNLYFFFVNHFILILKCIAICIVLHNLLLRTGMRNKQIEFPSHHRLRLKLRRIGKHQNEMFL